MFLKNNLVGGKSPSGLNQKNFSRDEPKRLRDSVNQFSYIQAGPSDRTVFSAMCDGQF